MSPAIRKTTPPPVDRERETMRATMSALNRTLNAPGPRRGGVSVMTDGIRRAIAAQSELARRNGGIH